MSVGDTKVKDLPAHKRPRERLFKFGSKHLSNVQLLAILIGSGRSKLNAISLARKVIKQYPFKELADSTPNDLIAIPGVGKAIAARIAAAIELADRLKMETNLPPRLTDPEKVLLIINKLEKLKQERLVVLYLDSRHQLLKQSTVAVGSINTTLVHPREIFAPALSLPVTKIIIAHNHPSGELDPSGEDISFTKRVAEGGKILGIKVIDHLIVSGKGYFSFREAELL